MNRLQKDSMSFEEYFWGNNEGYEYRRFTYTKNIKDMQDFRMFSAAVITILNMYGTYMHEGIPTFKFLTSWGAYFVMFSFIFIYIATIDQIEHPRKIEGWRFTLWRVTIILMEISVTVQTLIVLIFWSLLYHPHQPITLNYIYTHLIHSLPYIFILIEFYKCQWVFRWSHIIFVWAFMIFYLFLNLAVTVYTGKPVYPIMTWNDMLTVVIIISFSVLIILFFYIFYTIAEKRMNDESRIITSLPKKVEKYVAVIYVPINDVRLINLISPDVV